jgi:STE24 endopeptidase
MLYLYPVLIAPLFNKFSPLPDGEMKDAIVDLLHRTQFQFSGLFVMDASKRSSHGNAYFTGFGKNKRIVFYDTLIGQLSKEEVVAVLAHELGHFKKKHILKMLLASMIFGFIGFFLLGFFYQDPSFYKGHGFAQSSAYVALYLFSTVISLYLFPLTPLFSYFSRKNEFEADTFASEYANAKDLISALLKMYKDNASTLTPSPAYSKFYYSHPPASERIQNLKSLIKET